MDLFLQILAGIVLLPFAILGLFIAFWVAIFIFKVLSALGGFAIGVLLFIVILGALLDDSNQTKIGLI